MEDFSTEFFIPFEESETSSPDKGSLKQLNFETIKPHEQRALNFLINEYLLLHGYKLTSITFADENENQDFEDWDDVGLNIAKPVELLQLYREGLKRTGCGNVCAHTQTELVLKDEKAEEKIAELVSRNVIRKLNKCKSMLLLLVSRNKCFKI